MEHAGGENSAALDRPGKSKGQLLVEGTHEAIVSKEYFELAQKVIRGGGRNPTHKQHDYPLKGLVRCGNCKRATSTVQIAAASFGIM